MGKGLGIESQPAAPAARGESDPKAEKGCHGEFGAAWHVHEDEQRRDDEHHQGRRHDRAEKIEHWLLQSI